MRIFKLPVIAVSVVLSLMACSEDSSSIVNPNGALSPVETSSASEVTSSGNEAPINEISSSSIEAPVNGVDIFTYNDKSNGAIQYRAIVAELIEREEL